jgi:hypothetical protein
VTSMPDDTVRVKVTVKFFTAAIAAPVQDEDDNDGGNGGNASSNSTNNRTSVTAFGTRASRHDDNRRTKGGSDYDAIGFC